MAMERRWLLSCGPLAAMLFIAGVLVLGALVPAYDLVRQTVSEIGAAGSPMQEPFALLLSLIALCLIGFAGGVWALGRGRFGALLVLAMAVSVAGVGIFAFPHALHNVFGQSELIGFLAPLAFAISWRGEHIGLTSWVAFALLWASVAVNLAYLGLMGEDARAVLHPMLEPIYGLVQRTLFVIWFGWCGLIGLMLSRAAK